MEARQHRSILHVDLDAFFVAVEQRLNPELLGLPVIVGGRRGQRGVVATASYEARVFGVHSGMAIALAERLCPQAVFLPVNFSLYGEASDAFFDILRSYTPLVEAASLDEAYLDLTGCEPIAGSAREAAEEIQRRVGDEIGLGCSIGIAPSKAVAKVATEVAKPAGIRVVPPGQEAPFLAPLPVRYLPMVGPKVAETLAEFGVRTVGQIANLPQSLLDAKFGTMGSILWLRANGVDATPVHGEHGPAKSVGREVTFGSDVSDVSHLKATLRWQAEKVGAELRRNGQVARSVALKLRYIDFTTITRNDTFKQATDLDQTLFLATTALLDEALTHDVRAVRLIGLRAIGLAAAKQLPLWETEQNSEKLTVCWDEIRAKYGSSYLQTGRTFFRQDGAELRMR